MIRPITHYTDLHGFNGIISNNKIWASNTAYLNDTKELVHGIDILGEAYDRLTWTSEDAPLVNCLQNAIAQARDGGLPTTYVACFAKNPDSLTHWRGYCTGQGISITFDGDLLASNAGFPYAAGGGAAWLQEVIYADEGALGTKIEELVRMLVSRLREAVIHLGGSVESGDLPIARDFVSLALPRIKHGGFRDEDEVRMIVQPSNPNAITGYRVKGNTLVPYLALPDLLVYGNVAPLPITSVTVGPGPDQKRTALSIQGFLKWKHFDHVTVNLSEVPFVA
ncbi:DUF2971 domain-containing protein [Silvimonas iriomotensis]|uniref:DUF2971 domain-containing protein n=1 Tax=Silvimonas iriomotensis TaxID=449662 RepID=A0ABQ2PD21_9NEIS|nr:DUF2971 domain-containing protein [Silvimonas iriomotensis]GGP23291.1 hypothetical protein GCM10010970_32910 [Silvimonas iriomotensis]